MNVYFSSVIKAGDRKREFNFRQLTTDSGIKYNVDVPDDRGNRITFSMHKNNEGQWKTTSETLPNWIIEAENELSKAIEENASLAL